MADLHEGHGAHQDVQPPPDYYDPKRRDRIRNVIYGISAGIMFLFVMLKLLALADG